MIPRAALSNSKLPNAAGEAQNQVTVQLQVSSKESAERNLQECDIGISIEDVKTLDVNELPVAFKLALKRLIKFRDMERQKVGEVPSVPFDPLCRKAYDCMKEMQKIAAGMGLKLQFEV